MGFSKALVLLKKLEGGFVNNPHDPGGETMMGVRKDLYLKANPGAPWPPSEGDIANYYKARYWDAFHCGDLPEPADSIFFQFVVSSERGSVEALQCIVGVLPDGEIGPSTLAAVKAYGSKDVADALLLAQRVFYVAKHSAGDYYFKGLQNRVQRVADAWGAGLI
jgi:lysozyme family protein